MKNNNNIIIAILIILLLSILPKCATVTQPGGGPRDQDPPTLLNSSPVKGQLNFKERSITLEFDELVDLYSPKEQIIITPRLKEEYEIIAKNNIVTIDLLEDLLENTTYTFSFREAIQDITEKNSALDLTLSLNYLMTDCSILRSLNL